MDFAGRMLLNFGHALYDLVQAGARSLMESQTKFEQQAAQLVDQHGAHGCDGKVSVMARQVRLDEAPCEPIVPSRAANGNAVQLTTVVPA
jgi:hypothetical protein